jgi:hypothetical protein
MYESLFCLDIWNPVRVGAALSRLNSARSSWIAARIWARVTRGAKTVIPGGRGAEEEEHGSFTEVWIMVCLFTHQMRSARDARLPEGGGLLSNFH